LFTAFALAPVHNRACRARPALSCKIPMRIHHPPVPDLPAISLRQIERADMDAWYAYLRLPAVTEHTSWNLGSGDDLLPLFDAFESPCADSQRRLAAIDNRSGQMEGSIGFHTISDVNRTAEIAYDLAPAYWGRGIAKALCAAVTRWAFQEYGFIRIQAAILESNKASARVVQACGYRHEGLLRSLRLVRGMPRDYALYARLAADE
jgi:RimJ/RimL family protein N-acetyltransferase